MSKIMNFDCSIVRWVDGDTVDVNVDLGFSIWSKQRIRLADIDTPERGQENFTEATEKVKELAPVGTVCQLVCKGKDRYGRYIGTIVNNGLNLSTELVHLGLAKRYTE